VRKLNPKNMKNKIDVMSRRVCDSSSGNSKDASISSFVKYLLNTINNKTPIAAAITMKI